MNDYPALLSQLLERSEIPGLLSERPAVVLERLARAAGATRWYRANSSADLEWLCGRLWPGSIACFYFDDRMTPYLWGAEARARILGLLPSAGEVVVCTAREDSPEMDVEFIAGPSGLEEFDEEIQPGAQVFIGDLSAAENDGINAVSLILPDRDGVTRGHPH